MWTVEDPTILNSRQGSFGRLRFVRHCRQVPTGAAPLATARAMEGTAEWPGDTSPSGRSRRDADLLRPRAGGSFRSEAAVTAFDHFQKSAVSGP